MHGIVLLLILFACSAYGYIDPGVGSYFLQLFIGFLLAALFLVGSFRSRIIAFLRNLFRKKDR